MKRTFLCCMAALCLCAFPSDAQHVVWFDKPCSSTAPPVWGDNPDIRCGSSRGVQDWEWEHASLPIGNGSIGANVFGSVSVERLSFNEKTLWFGGPGTGASYYWDVNKQSAHLLPEIRQAFLDGDIDKATRLTQDNFNSPVSYETEDETPSRFGTFTTAGEFRISTGIDEDGITDYRRALSLDSAMVTVNFRKSGTMYKRSFFVSYLDNVMVIRFTADRPSSQNLELSYLPNPLLENGSFEVTSRDAMLYCGSLPGNNLKYAMRLKVHSDGGDVEITPEGLVRVKGADDVTFVITADTDYRINFDPDFSDPAAYVGEDPVRTTGKWLKSAGRKSYPQLFERHYEDYASLFCRADLVLNPADAARNAHLPTPERLERYRAGESDFALETLYWQFGRYLLIASSRPGNLPANLQGMWHNNINGPWHIDYHNNINLQMNYWPACQTNLSECELPLFDYIRMLVKPGEKTAQAYFGARGWTASISANIFGFTTPLRDKNMVWNLIPMAGPWLATHIWNYYDYTRDEDFLRSVGYDLIRSSADFTADILWRTPDGVYTAAPSTSPEHGPIDKGATFAHAVAREILEDAIAASEVLGTDSLKRERWQSVLDSIAPYQIGRYGQLMEWSEDIDDPEDEHRHVNHLFGLHPGHTISPFTTPDLAEASRVVLEHRGDLATGWSMGWKLNQWARLLDGNHAYVLYGNLLKTGTNENLWDSHPPFQIDGNFGGTAGVTEMLLQSHMGFIHLLPSLPDAWHEGSLEGVCARGDFTVDIFWKDNALTEAVIHSGSGVPCCIHYAGQDLEFETVSGKDYVLEPVDGKLAVCEVR